MALIGTISGSNGTSTTAISGSLIIADEPASGFPTLAAGVKLFVSGNKTTLGSDTPNTIFGGDTFVSGAFGTDSYIQLKPVGPLRVPTNTTASYIYTSGSTNDIYFTQYQPGTGYTNTTRLRWLEGGLSTGLLTGGSLSSTSGSTTYNINSGSGIIVTYNAHGGATTDANEPFPTIVRVQWPALTGQTLPSISTTQITYIAMTSAGTPILKSIPFTNGEYNDYIVLGRILHTDKAGTNGAVNQPAVAYGLNQFRGDFTRAFGPIKLSGHTLSANGTQGLQKEAGDSYAEGRNYTVDPDNPNYISSTTDTAQLTSKIFYEYVNASGDDVIANNGNLGYTALDFAQYNNAGTLTTVGAGNKFTIQRVYWFPNAVNRAFYVYYGNTIYATLSDAQAGISTEVFTEGKNTRDAAIFLGYVIVKGTGLDFTDPTTYKIVQAGSFRAVASSGAGATGTPGGADTYVQFNDASAFNGTSEFRFVKGTGTALVTNLAVTGSSAGSLVSSGTFQVKGATGEVVGSISTGGVISGSSDLQIGGNITGSNAVLRGDLAVNGGDITSTAGTLNIAALTNVTNLYGSNVLVGSTGNTNLSGSAVLINAGSPGISIQRDTSTYATISGDATSVTVGSTVGRTTANVFNANSTTINFGGAANAIKLGATNAIVSLSGTMDLSGTAVSVIARLTGGDISLSSASRAKLGTGDNMLIFHNGSNFAMNNSTGHILVSNNAVNQRIEMILSSSTAAGIFRVKRAYGPSGGAPIDNLLDVRADGSIMIGSGTAGIGLSSTIIGNDLFLNTGVVAVSADAVPIQLVSSGNVTVKLDANNNAPSHFFSVQDYRGIDQFKVFEEGNAEILGNLTVTGSVLDTKTTTTFNLLNNTLTGTLNIGGATTTINFGSPTTTGSMQGDLTVANRATLGGVIEKMFHTQSAGGGITNFNLIGQSIFYVNNPASNISANFTNAPITTDRIITPTVILSQSATARIVSVVQIDGIGQTINWANGVTPTGTAGKQDVFGFSLIRSGSAWKVLGQMSTYG